MLDLFVLMASFANLGMLVYLGWLRLTGMTVSDVLDRLDL